MNKIKKDPLYSPEMDRFTDEYVDYVSQIAYGFGTTPKVAVEMRLDYSSYAPEGFGTGDCVILSGSELHVIDFKYGTGVPVSAEANPQLSLYALGAVEAYGMLYPADKVTLHVAQPRLKNFSSWQTQKKELEAWGNTMVRPKAELAFKGEGGFSPAPDVCRFCRAVTCRARAEKNLELKNRMVDPVTGEKRFPPLLSDSEVGSSLSEAQDLAAWVKKLEKYALDAMLGGKAVKGWKVVEGRSNRTFTDIDAAYAKLQEAGYDRALLYDSVPVTLTAAEKLVDKETYEKVLAPFIVKPPGAPTIAPETDKRPEYRVKSATEVFSGENAYKEGE